MIFPIFEQLVPFIVSYFLERSLRTLHAGGSIDDYRTRTVRTGKCQYRIDVRLVINEVQVKTIFNNLLTKLFNIRVG